MNKPSNQCQGCQAGWLLEFEESTGLPYHRTTYPNGRSEYIGCTRERYEFRDPED